MPPRKKKKIGNGITAAAASAGAAATSTGATAASAPAVAASAPAGRRMSKKLLDAIAERKAAGFSDDDGLR